MSEGCVVVETGPKASWNLIDCILLIYVILFSGVLMFGGHINWVIVFSLVAIILSAMSLLVGFLSLALWYGLRTSTHKAQFIPVDEHRQLFKGGQPEPSEPPRDLSEIEDMDPAKNGVPVERILGLTKEPYGDEIV